MDLLKKIINICRKAYENVIQFISSIEINCVEKSNEFQYVMHAEGTYKGFFIECENVDEINEIQLIISDKNIFNFDKFLIKKKCVKINKSFLYFPFNFDEKYTDRTLESLAGSLRLSGRITKLIIKLDNEISKICIYNFSYNLLRIADGMIGLASLYEDTAYQTGHYYADFNKEGIYQRKLQQNYRCVKLKKKNKYKNVIHKPIEEYANSICCGTRKYIYEGSNYITCIKCDNNFSEHWFNSNYEKKCLFCLNDMSNIENIILFKNCKTFKKIP